jgi:beta-lactamase class A
VQEKIKEMAAAARAETVAVAYYDFATGNQMLLNADESFHAASTMKVPVMMEVFEQQKAGALNFDQRLAVRNDFISLADGSHYSISSESDSEKSLYEKIGQTATIREFMRLMIISSSNLAANILIEKVSAEKVMALMRRIGADHIKVLRGVEDGKAYDRGLNNITTARDLMIIMRLIAERRAVSEAASDQMIRIMLDQKFNEAIPAGLPPNVRVAHKTGNITKINHDAAIVYPPNRKPYVLVGADARDRVGASSPQADRGHFSRGVSNLVPEALDLSSALHVNGLDRPHGRAFARTVVQNSPCFSPPPRWMRFSAASRRLRNFGVWARTRRSSSSSSGTDMSAATGRPFLVMMTGPSSLCSR